MVNPFLPLSAEEIYDKLVESRACYERGEYIDADVAIDEISKKYGLERNHSQDSNE